VGRADHKFEEQERLAAGGRKRRLGRGRNRQESLGDALFAASPALGRVSASVNKGPAGAPADAIVGARNTAINPAVLDAFALMISRAEGPPAYPGIPGHEPDLPAARRRVEAIDRAITEMRTRLPTVGSYVASQIRRPKWVKQCRSGDPRGGPLSNVKLKKHDLV
jgi:hypothetical protein